MSARTSIHNFLTRPWVLIGIILGSAILSYLYGGPGYFFGMAAALLVLWGSRYDWSAFGLGKPDWVPTFLRALLYAILLYAVMDVLVQPLVEYFYGAIDLSAFDGLRGNFVNYIIFILFMWVVAAIGEEFLYRGFFMKRFAEILGGSNNSWLLAGVLISALFGIAHLYQGISGVLTTGLIGLGLSMIFYFNRKNLVLCMLTHGLYDMIGISMIYLNKERLIVDWMLNLLNA
jgi:membrane protease YdiL (CAAX protease family)